jgi:hypothetical protein
VSSEKQTLILAGETVPQRDLAGRRPITIVATPVDDPKLLAQGYAGVASTSAFSQSLAPSNRWSERSNAYGAASAYARTQGLSESGDRKIIIDAYA